MNSFEEMMEIISTAVIFMIAVGFIIFTFSLGYENNDMLVESIGNKASSRYAGGTYGDIHAYISPTDALSDILASEPTVNIQIDGSDLSVDVLEKARNNESLSIHAIRLALVQSRYYKVPTYNANGTIVSINYIGG